MASVCSLLRAPRLCSEPETDDARDGDDDLLILDEGEKGSEGKKREKNEESVEIVESPPAFTCGRSVFGLGLSENANECASKRANSRESKHLVGSD